MKIPGTAALLSLALSITGAAAETSRSSEAHPEPSPWRLGLALGYGERSNPLIQSDDIPLVVDVDIAWFGERFFFDNGDLGFTVMNNNAVTASIVARVNSDRLFFSRTNTRLVRVGAHGTLLAAPVQVTVPDRDYAAELGFEVLADGRWGMLQFTAHHDVGGTHDGYELFLDYGYGWRNQRWYVEPSAGIAFKSRAMNDYYWGVRPGEANDALPAHRAGSGVNPHARLLVSYQLSRHWAFSAAAEFERLNGDAAASPIVAERNVVGYFAGFGYRF